MNPWPPIFMDANGLITTAVIAVIFALGGLVAQAAGRRARRREKRRGH